MPIQSKNKLGFTIVELIVAISVFAILVPAVSSFLNLLGAINDRARDTSVINALVEHKIEELRSISFVGVDDGTVDFTTELPATIADPATRSAEYEVSSLTTSLKQIDVTVSYVDHGQTRTLEYRTYLGELGVGQY
jgi:prepilin-type N-terminal cleavage/methylation domain-containing protein